MFLDTAGGIRMGNPGDDATSGGNPGKAARAVGEIDLAVVAPIGAAEGLLLDRSNPKWRSRYFAEKFDNSSYFTRK